MSGKRIAGGKSLRSTLDMSVLKAPLTVTAPPPSTASGGADDLFVSNCYRSRSDVVFRHAAKVESDFTSRLGTRDGFREDIP